MPELRKNSRLRGLAPPKQMQVIKSCKIMNLVGSPLLQVSWRSKHCLNAAHRSTNRGHTLQILLSKGFALTHQLARSLEVSLPPGPLVWQCPLGNLL